jgi:hypothetical protein
MANTMSKLVLSGSTNGKAVKIAATATPGTTLHTAGSGSTNFDEVWLWLYNSHTADVEATIEFGGTTSPDDTIKFTIKTKDGLKLVLPGLVLQNSLVLKAFASVTNVITAHGYVNRITVS